MYLKLFPTPSMTRIYTSEYSMAFVNLLLKREQSMVYFLFLAELILWWKICNLYITKLELPLWRKILSLKLIVADQIKTWTFGNYCFTPVIWKKIFKVNFFQPFKQYHILIFDVTIYFLTQKYVGQPPPPPIKYA